MSLEFITKIESSAKDLAIAAQISGNQSVASDLEKIIKASTIFNDQITQLNSEPGQNDTLQSALNNGQIRHDLRTPLVAILGYSEMLIEDSDEIDIANFKSIMDEMHAIAAQLLLCIDEHSDQLTITSLQNNKTTYATEQANGPGTDLLTTLLSFTQLDQQIDNEQITGKILIVDDHAMNCEVLTRYVERQGHSAIAVLGGHEAIKALREDDFDVLLLDLHMPNMNGYEVLQIMQSDANLRHIPVIMISAIDEIDKVVKCIELGAQDYLPKPINQVLLKARIGASLQKKRLHDMEILHLQQVKAERSRADDLLKVIFPAVIAEELKATKQVKPRRHENVAVFF